MNTSTSTHNNKEILRKIQQKDKKKNTDEGKGCVHIHRKNYHVIYRNRNSVYYFKVYAELL